MLITVRLGFLRLIKEFLSKAENTDAYMQLMYLYVYAKRAFKTSESKD